MKQLLSEFSELVGKTVDAIHYDDYDDGQLWMSFSDGTAAIVFSQQKWDDTELVLVNEPDDCLKVSEAAKAIALMTPEELDQIKERERIADAKYKARVEDEERRLFERLKAKYEK